MERILKSSILHVAVGFLLMGGWALFANRSHGLDQAWLPAVVQGTISAGLTWALKKTLEGLNDRIDGPAAFVVPPVITAGSILLLLAGVHRLIGTPELLATIAVPWSLSSLYAIVYNARIVADRRKTA